MKTEPLVLDPPKRGAFRSKSDSRQQQQRPTSGMGEMAGILDGIVTKDGIFATEIPFLGLIRRSNPTSLGHGMLRPSICLVVQGKKRTILGREIVTYGAGSYVLSSVDFPSAGQVVEASPSVPYLGINIDLEPDEIASVRLEAKISASDKLDLQGATFAESDSKLEDVQLRFVRLLREPAENIAFLAPILRRELIFRLFSSPAARPVLDAFARHRKSGIYEAIAWMKKNFREPIPIERLAQKAGTSKSVFHRQFRALTTLSPLQYRQRLRLLEARRLLLTGSDAATAAFDVGYESATQFSREYSRLFGEPPRRDIDQLNARR